MKEGIHPNYNHTTITCACGNVIETARDADPQLTQALAEQAVAQGVETVWFGSRKELGHACGITVGAAAAAEL